MIRNCSQCKSQFEITDADREYYARIEVPEPLFCPTCRLRRRLVFRNERNYYSRPCDLCKKPIISVYDPARTKNVYCLQCWWSDKWSAKDYGREFDVSRPFFEQYAELLREVPKLAMMNDNGVKSVNCEYTYDISSGKDCYMVIASWHMENCMYGFQTNHVIDCVDNLFVNGSQLMYGSVACEDSYNCQQCQQCKGCRDCIFGYDLKNCNDCLFSAGLQNKQYCIWNKQHSKEEYLAKKKELDLGSAEKRAQYQKEFAEFVKKIPRRFASLVNCEDSTGDNLVRCKNAKACFYFGDLEHCKFMTFGYGGKDSYDCYSTGQPELCYDSITPDNSYLARHTVFCWKSQLVTYSENCHSSENLFGCVGMKRVKYCILNKEYSKEEYLALEQKIIASLRDTGQWGQFFTPEVTLFAYNETAAQEQCPLDKAQAEALGYKWADQRAGAFGKETLRSADIPDHIKEVPETMCQGILACIACGKNYRILKQEFDFYKRQEVPIPKQCPDCRHLVRLQLGNPRKLWHRQCMCAMSGHAWHTVGKCKNQFETTYAPERPEMIYCEQCYQSEMV